MEKIRKQGEFQDENRSERMEVFAYEKIHSY